MKTSWSLPFRYLVGVLVVVAFVAFVSYARRAVSALVVAGFIAYLIHPLVMLLLRYTRLSRTAAVNIVYFSALILLAGIPATLTPIFFNEAQMVAQDLLDLTDQLNEALSRPVEFGGYVFHFEQFARDLSGLRSAVLSPLPEELLRVLESTSVGVLWLLVILVSVHLLLSHWPEMRDWLIGLAPDDYQDEVRELYERIRRLWMAYLRGQIVLMLIVGIVFTIAWTVIGIPGALALGVIAGFFTLVPDVGPFLAAILAVGVALLEGSSWIPLPNLWVAGITLATYLVLINLKNFFLRPYVMGRSVHMNEGLVFIAILIATILAGILGALLVVPVLASVAVIGKYIRRRLVGLSPFEEGGRVQFLQSGEEVEVKPLRQRKRDAKTSKKGTL
ncbi:MAG: AI-2E family transporter [Anaerolineales bacterium]